jgi:hypothetical protein
MNLVPPAYDHMSIPHDETSCTGTETDSVHMCTVSGWLQHPRFSGKNPFSQADKFFPEKHSWCTDRDRTHNRWSRICSLGNNQRAAWCGHFVDHVKSEPEPPDLRPSSNVDFPVAWITGPATDPSLTLSHL